MEFFDNTYGTGQPYRRENKVEDQVMDAALSRKVDDLASEIFETWDVERDGVVFSDDIINATDVHDEEFGIALGRVLCKDNSGKIYSEDLAACLKTLRYGSLPSQVELLMKFMDRDCNGNVSLSTVQSYLQISNDKLLDRLGLSGDKTNIQFEDLLGLFAKTERGPDAINVFCNQIIRILMKQTKVKRQNLTDHMSEKHFSHPRDTSHSTPLIDLPALCKRLYEHCTVSSLTKSGLTALQITLWLLNVHHYHHRGKALSFCFAKGFGLNLRVLTLILFLSMARSTLAALNNFTFLRPFLFSGHSIQAHAFCGTSTFFHALGHAGMHAWHQSHHRKGGFAQSFRQESLLGGLLRGRWKYGGDVSSGDGVTGVLLLALVLVMTASAICRGYSSMAYLVFSRLHFLYSAWLGLLALHAPHLWPYFFAVALLMLLDRGYDFFFLTLHSTLASSRPCNNGSSFLSIPYSAHSGHAGCYYRVKVPALSLLEWHPFSLASSESSHHLTFFVASSGDWTRQLHELVSDPQRRATARVLVQGPFSSPAKQVLRSPAASVLLVASGIGITPFFSVLATKVTDEYVRAADRLLYERLFHEDTSAGDGYGEENGYGGSYSCDVTVAAGALASSRSSLGALLSHDPADVRVLRVVWVIRDAADLMFYVDYVYHLVKHQSSLAARAVVHVEIFLTGLGRSSDPSYMIAQTLFLLVVSGQLADHIQIKFGRPNLSRIVDNVNPDQVFFCGGRALKNQVKRVCSDRRIDFCSENFDSAGSSVLDWFLSSACAGSGRGMKPSFASQPSERERARYGSSSTQTYSFSNKLSFW